MNNPVQILWFDRDLRTYDHEGLRIAQSLGTVVGIYIIDPNWLTSRSFDIPKMSYHRQRYLYETLVDLKENLERFNIPLYVYIDQALNTFKRLVKNLNIDHIISMKQYTKEENEREEVVRNDINGITWIHYEGKTLIHPDDLPYRIDDLPNIFTNFRKTVEKHPILPRKTMGYPKIQSPILIDLMDDYDQFIDLFQSIPSGILKGGETAGQQRIQHYFFETKKLKFYKLTRNQMYRLDDSSKLSPYLALGSLSPRMIYEQIKRFELIEGDNLSTYWLYFELLWRDYFEFILMKYGNLIFQKRGLFQKKIKINPNPQWIDHWKTGKTGYPLVDANMIELMTTGWMSNRGRQNVASFFTKYINQDWRIGAMWFESLLIDYDPASNYGNWLYQAGLGVDPKSSRIFDVIWQGEKYDPTTIYLRKWLPIFKKIPKFYRYRPMAMTYEQQEASDFILGVDYPKPIVPMPFKTKNLK